MDTTSNRLAIDQYHDDLNDYWKRNPVSRRSLLKGALIGAGALALVNVPLLRRAFAASGRTSGTSGALIVGRHVAFPKEAGHDPTNAMRATALVFPTSVLAGGLAPVLRYGTSDSYGSSVTADIVNLSAWSPTRRTVRSPAINSTSMRSSPGWRRRRRITTASSSVTAP